MTSRHSAARRCSEDSVLLETCLLRHRAQLLKRAVRAISQPRPLLHFCVGEYGGYHGVDLWPASTPLIFPHIFLELRRPDFGHVWGRGFVLLATVPFICFSSGVPFTSSVFVPIWCTSTSPSLAAKEVSAGHRCSSSTWPGCCPLEGEVPVVARLTVGVAAPPLC